jgi:hypothetical protein
VKEQLTTTILFDSNYIEPALLTSYLIMKGQYKGIANLILIYIDKEEQRDEEAKAIIQNYVNRFTQAFPLSAIKIRDSIPSFSRYHFTNTIIYKPFIPSLISTNEFVINIDAGVIPGKRFDAFIDYTISHCKSSGKEWIISAFCEELTNLHPLPIAISDNTKPYPNGQILLFNKESFAYGNFMQRYMLNYQLHKNSLVYAEQELICITANAGELSQLPLASERKLYSLDIKPLWDKNLILNHTSIDDDCVYSKVIGTLKPWKYWVLDPNKKHWIEKIKLMEAEFPISQFPLIVSNRHEVTNTQLQRAFLECHHNLI